MEKKKARDYELLMGLFLFFGSLVIYWYALQLPSSPYEPLGPGFVPRSLSLMIAILSLAITAPNAMSRLRRAPEKQVDGSALASSNEGVLASSAESSLDELGTESYTRRPGLAAVVVMSIFLYIYVMYARVLGFRPATFLFLMTVGNVLFYYERKVSAFWHQLVLIVLSLGLSFGLYYVFTSILFVNIR